MEALCPMCGDGVTAQERDETEQVALDFCRGEVACPVCGDQLERVG